MTVKRRLLNPLEIPLTRRRPAIHTTL